MCSMLGLMQWDDLPLLAKMSRKSHARETNWSHQALFVEDLRCHHAMAKLSVFCVQFNSDLLLGVLCPGLLNDSHMHHCNTLALCGVCAAAWYATYVTQTKRSKISRSLSTCALHARSCLKVGLYDACSIYDVRLSFNFGPSEIAERARMTQVIRGSALIARRPSPGWSRMYTAHMRQLMRKQEESVCKD